MAIPTPVNGQITDMEQEEQGKILGKLVAKARAEEGFRQRLLAEPMVVLYEEGIEVPEGFEVKVVEDTDIGKWAVLPTCPSVESTDSISDRGADGPLVGTSKVAGSDVPDNMLSLLSALKAVDPSTPIS